MEDLRKNLSRYMELRENAAPAFMEKLLHDLAESLSYPSNRPGNIDCDITHLQKVQTLFAHSASSILLSVMPNDFWTDTSKGHAFHTMKALFANADKVAVAEVLRVLGDCWDIVRYDPHTYNLIDVIIEMCGL